MSQQNGKMSVVQALHQYFGRKPNQTAAQFRDELNALNDADKHELAEGAAKELGVELEVN